MSALIDELAGAEDRLETLRRIVSQFSESQAWQRPAEGGWCLMEMLSHLVGPAEEPMLAGLTRGLLETSPTLLAGPGDSYLTGPRLGLSSAALLQEATASLTSMTALGRSLSDEQAERTLRIPWLAATPLGETPTIGTWLGGLLTFHLDDHLQQLESLAERLGLATGVH